MAGLTEKQRLFAVNKAAGVKNKEAAIAAGYSPNTASIQAAQLMGREDIRAAIKRAKKAAAGGTDPTGVNIVAETGLDPQKNTMPKGKYDDPIAFLEDVMNHKHLPIAMRADAAKQLLPYKHARVGEAGKKEKAKDRAREVAGAGKATKPRYAPKQAPRMRVITGGKT